MALFQTNSFGWHYMTCICKDPIYRDIPSRSPYFRRQTIAPMNMILNGTSNSRVKQAGKTTLSGLWLDCDWHYNCRGNTTRKWERLKVLTGTNCITFEKVRTGAVMDSYDYDGRWCVSRNPGKEASCHDRHLAGAQSLEGAGLVRPNHGYKTEQKTLQPTLGLGFGIELYTLQATTINPYQWTITTQH